MKKFLSVALALAMTLSLVVVGASATEYKDLKDKDQIKHSEAVSVMNKIGVISGYTDGTFKPTASITRGAAAKIVCYAKLGATVASALSSETAPFKDVSVKNVFAPYITYCTNMKIVNGYSDKTFRPSTNLTGYAFAKMLLNALGINGTYTGNGWEVNVATAAQNAHFFTGIDSTVAMSKALSRDNACQMALNAMVYSATGSTVYRVTVTYADGTTRDTTPKAFDFTSSSEAMSFYAVMNGQKDTTADKTAGLITAVTYKGSTTSTSADSLLYTAFKVTRNTNGTDSYGRPSTTYTNSTWDAPMVFKSTPVKTYTTAVTAGKLFTDLNGYSTAITGVKNAATKGTTTSITPKAGDNTKLVESGNGVLTEVYNIGTSSAPNYTVVVTAPKFGTVKVASVAATSSAGAYTKYTVDSTDYKVFSSVIDKAADVNTAVVSGTVANGDHVQYYQDQSGIMHIEAVSTISGILTAKSNDNVYTIGGKTYEVAAATGAAAPVFNGTNTQTFYVDSYGYILGAKDMTSATYDYALLLKTGDSWTLNGSTLTGVKTATLAYPDGTVKTVNLVDTNDKVLANSDTTIDSAVKTVVSYSTKVNGTYLTAVASKADTATSGYVGVATLDALSKGVNTLGATKLYANAATKFVYVDYDGSKPAGTVTVKTGVNNIANIASGAGALAVDLDQNGVADVVYITADVNETATSSFVFMTGAYNQTGASTYIHSGFQNGAAVSITTQNLTGDNALTQGLYESVSVTGGDATVTAAAKLAGVTGVKVVGGLLFTTTDGTSYTVTPVAKGSGSSATLSAGTVAAVGSTVPMYEIDTGDNTCVAVKDASVAVEGDVYVQMADANTISAIYVVHA